jgi:hypothetical protein
MIAPPAIIMAPDTEIIGFSAEIMGGSTSGAVSYIKKMAPDAEKILRVARFTSGYLSPSAPVRQTSGCPYLQ